MNCREIWTDNPCQTGFLYSITPLLTATSGRCGGERWWTEWIGSVSFCEQAAASGLPELEMRAFCLNSCQCFFFLAALYFLGPHSVQPGTSTEINWPMSTAGEKKYPQDFWWYLSWNKLICMLPTWIPPFQISSMSISNEFPHHQPENNNTPKNPQDTGGINIYLLFPMFWLHFYLFSLAYALKGALFCFLAVQVESLQSYITLPLHLLFCQYRGCLLRVVFQETLNIFVWGGES